MRPLHALAIAALGLFAACELTLGLDDKSFCDDDPEGCDAVATSGATTSAGGGGASSSTSSTSSSSTGGADDCATYTFNEEWEAGALTGWQILDGDDDVKDPMGTLFIEPDNTNDYWWDNDQSPFVYREVCGDFGIHVQIDAIEPMNSLLPNQQYNGAGILVRNPQPGSGALNEHWLLLSHGFQQDGVGAAGYWSGPQDGGNFMEVMNYDPPAIGAQLSLCRFQGEWHAYFLPDCAPRPTILFGHPDSTFALPDRVQVGVTVHRRTPGERIEGRFRWTNLFRPQSLQECMDVLDLNYMPSTCPS